MTREQNPCENCIFEEGSKYCIEHCPYEAKQEPCDDAISREAVIGAICDYVAFEEYEDKSHTFTIRPLKKRIDALPSVQPSRKGHWIEVTNGRGGHECDKCHDYAPSYQTGEEYLSNFCPNCGADMRGSKVSE